jgi:hypothetical protein
MRRPHLPNGDQPSTQAGTDQSERIAGMEPLGQPTQFVENGTVMPNGSGTATGPHVAIEGVGDAVDDNFEIVCKNCIGRISRARTRYQEGDQACEGDYRAAFLFDARLTASQFIQELNREITNNTDNLVQNCMDRLIVDPGDVVALARLGLTLLLLYDDDEAFPYLKRAFVQNPLWRPLLRLLVKKAKLRRACVLTSKLM